MAKPFNAVMHAFALLYNRLPGAYNGLVGALGYSAPTLVAHALAEELSQAQKPAAINILDAGCGTGLTAQAVLQRFPGATVCGFDLSDKMLAEARKTNRYARLQTANATQALPFDDNSFDAAVSSGLYTLGHVGPEALTPVLDTIKPGGLFALNIYDAAWEELHFEEAINQLAAKGLLTVRAQER
ncbi:MAG: class I SAM-dependent methyltransferase, partial [Pseudomonadota bacterium]